jgi:GrpB-like predicted nucleotidyltransferase (UPF0157 family)
MIVISPHQAEWRDEFKAISRDVRKALGSMALRVDHIGSTAVPGLAAKDIIDIQVTVPRLHVAIEHSLKEAGFRRVERIARDHVPPGFSGAEEEWEKWFFKAAADRRPTNLHIRMAGRANQRYALLFRDYLRAHGDVAEAYARVKVALAQHHADDIEAYCDIKDPVCDVIMSGAEAWAAQVGWTPEPSGC